MTKSTNKDHQQITKEKNKELQQRMTNGKHLHQKINNNGNKNKTGAYRTKMQQEKTTDDKKH